jgi:gamma-glutamylcyclotransferase
MHRSKSSHQERSENLPVIYFAYGSNMNRAQMRARCPESRVLGHGFVMDHVLVFAQWSTARASSVASILRSPGDRTLGRVYELSEADVRRLDRFEGYPNQYKKKSVKVQMLKPSHKLNAMTYYIPRPFEESPPATPYFNIIAGAYAELGYTLERF